MYVVVPMSLLKEKSEQRTLGIEVVTASMYQEFHGFLKISSQQFLKITLASVVGRRFVMLLEGLELFCRISKLGDDKRIQLVVQTSAE